MPLEHTLHFAAQMKIDGSGQSQLGLLSQAELGLFFEDDDSSWEEFKVKGLCM